MGETVLIIIMSVIIIAGLVLAVKIDNGGNKDGDKKEKRK